ncbi:uncharacterized protein [Palaemon carinicauda]|uniref:uncharacterized protein n=1 Tax=Palaemon carinicauda TaxID=392227 RepID=UPI0035B5B2E7
MAYTDLKNEICCTWLRLNSDQMDQVRLHLLELSSSSKISRMRDIYGCSDLASALRLLEKWKLLTPYKVDVLVQLTEYLGMHVEMIKERVQTYTKSNLLSQPVSPITEEIRQPLQNNAIHQEICKYLSEILRGRWGDLGRCLGLSEFVSELQSSSIRQKDKIYQLLEEHFKKSGSTSISLLLKALEDCALIRQRDYILKNIIR